MIQKISIFGNPDYPMDSIPVKILPRLKNKFPGIQFVIEDPQECIERNNEDWWIIDTVVGVLGVELIEDFSKFEQTHSVSVHEYDLCMDLRILQKLGKVKNIHIIGISPEISMEEAITKVVSLISEN